MGTPEGGVPGAAGADTPPQGFATIPRSMLHDTSIPGDAKMVYLVLSSHVGGNHMAWPSYQRIADLIGRSKSQAKAMVRWLIEHEYVKRDAQFTDQGVQRTNAYTLLGGSAKPSANNGGQDMTPTGQVVTPTGQDMTPRGQVVPGEGAGGAPERKSLERESENEEQEPSSAAADADDRPEVTALCERLADRIEANGSKRPNSATKKWRDAARLLLDIDGRTVEQVEKAIDWCQLDEFWRTNILSMPTLRKQYDKLRLAAQRQREQAREVVVHDFARLREQQRDDAAERQERANSWMRRGAQ